MKQQTTQKTQLPEGWKIVRLGDICEKPQYGYTCKTSKEEVGPVLLRITDIGSFGEVDFNEIKYAKIPEKEKSKFLLSHGDILIARSGSIGKVYLHKNNKKDVIFASYLIRFKPKKDLVDSNFLFYYLNSPYFIKYIEENKSGVTQFNLNAQKMVKFELFLPPLPTQKLIVQKLNSFFEKYNKLKEEKQKAKENYERILGSVISTLIPSGYELPAGWEMKTIQEMIEGNIISDINPGFPSGKHHKNEKGYVHIRPMNVNLNGEIDYTTCKYVDRKKEYNNYILEKEDIIFNNTNSRELVGKTALFKNKKECVYSNHMTRIKVDNKKILPYYLAVYLHNLWRKGFFSVICHSHVSQASVSTNKLKETKIPLPSLELQHQIISKLEAIKQKYSKICEEQKLLDSYLEQLPKAVLSKAFKGDII